MKQRISSSHVENSVTISVSPPVSVKIENLGDLPSFSHAEVGCHENTSQYAKTTSLITSLRGTQAIKVSSKLNTCRAEDTCCSHGTSKLTKPRCVSPRSADVRKRRSRSGSRSPSLSSQMKSRSHHSRHSVDIKTECTTPTLHKKSSSSDRLTPHRPHSSAGLLPSSSSSFPLFTPAAVPAGSYFSAIRGSFPGVDTANVSNRFRGLPSHNGLFAPPAVGLHPSLMSSSLMMGLPNQFSSQEALLGANQDMLSRMQQELNARFLQDRSLMPLGLPPVPFTLHTEMHQHQHLHHHQHVLTPGTYLPTPAAQSAVGPAGLFQPPMSEKFPAGNDLLLHSQSLAELAERDRLAKQFAGLSGFPGLGMAPGLSSSVPFGRNLHPSGAFQPKAGNANLTNLNPASHLLLSLHEQEKLTRNSSLASVPKKRGRWCAAHVDIAWKIHHQKFMNKTYDPVALLRGGLDATKLSSSALLGGSSQLLGLTSNTGDGDLRPSLHPQGGSGLLQRPGPYTGIDAATFTGLTPAGVEGTLFGAQRAVASTGVLRSAVSRSGLRRSSPPLLNTASPPPSHKPDVMRDSRHDVEMRGRNQSSVHHSATSSARDNFRSLHSTHKSRSPDRIIAHSHRRSRSRSPLHRHAPVRSSDPAVRERDLQLGQLTGYHPGDFGIRSDMAAIRGGLMSGSCLPGHAFTSLTAQPKPPSAAVGSMSAAPSAASLSHDARKLMHERDRLSSLGSCAGFMPSPASSLQSQLLHSASTDAVLRDRLLNEQRDRMMLAAAAVEYGAQPPRSTDTSLRPELFAPHSDNILGVQSALLRPTLGCTPGVPVMKLQQAYGPMIDPTLASLNLPFR